MPETSSKRVYRLDRFTVPAASRGEFVDAVRNTHAVLREQPGFVQELLLEQPLPEGGTQVVTLVEWEGAEFIEGAKAAVGAMHRARGFSVQETMGRLGIRSELGMYTPIGR